jgi:hypothetical protein
MTKIKTVIAVCVLAFSANASMARTTQLGKQALDKCEQQWVDAFHKENGDDALISSDQIDAWDAVCKKGKNPKNYRFN